MMNQDNPYAMNQTCKVCGEPAAGFHFGAFTCEGCKSFFGRSYNNLSSISDCKNNGECIINKKNRTACKACRLRKCLLVGMSKSGSRYGRRSNWFKIHCLLQEQQQQAAAAMAAAAQHHNNQQQQQGGGGDGGGQHSGQHPITGATMNSHYGGGKPNMGPTGMGGFPGSAAAAAALGMLGHAGAYPGLYPRTKEELMMLGLEEYAAAAASAAASAKHPAVSSPCVSSPDSHNSDSSVDIGTKNPLLHFSAAKHAAIDVGSQAPPQQLRKDSSPALHHFLPGLPGFPGLGSMPVMPPPSFLPPSHLLFPGYHPALYAQHHQGLLKPSPEQQHAAAAAAAVQQLFNTSNSTPAARYTPTMSAMGAPGQSSPQLGKTVSTAAKNATLEEQQKHVTTISSPSYQNNNSSSVEQMPHITTNGDRHAAEELTKRFYLDAVLKSQRTTSPPPCTTKLPAKTRSLHDHSISALVTPNSESGSAGGGGRERFTSLQSQEDEHGEVDAGHAVASADDDDDDDEEDLVVAMTPPHSPPVSNVIVANVTPEKPTTPKPTQQDNPIDLSMKATGSGSFSAARSPLSSKESTASNSSSMHAAERESPQEHEEQECASNSSESEDHENGLGQRVVGSSECSETLEDEEDNSTVETVKTTILNNNNNNSNSNNSAGGNNNNNNNNNVENVAAALKHQHAKRKVEELLKLTQNLQDLQDNQNLEASKRLKLDFVNMAANLGAANVATVTTTAALDLTTKV